MKTYAKLRPLTEPRQENLGQTFQRLADSLRDSGKTATVQCTILGGGAPSRWTLELEGSDCRLHSEPAQSEPVQSEPVQSEPVQKPDLEIITRDITWWEVAEGKLSPLDAFTQGRLRILGDTELGSHLLALATDGGAVTICKT